MVSYSELRQMGLNLIPCNAKSKIPSIAWKEFQTKPCSLPLAENAAVICGKISGNIIVIDIDSPELVDKIFTDFEGIKANTLVVQTGSGGYHIYVKPKTPISTMRLTNKDSQHLDIQCDGTYVMAPGSIHPNGKTYEIISGVTKIDEMNVDGWVKSLKAHGFNPEGSGLKPIFEISKGVGSGDRNNSAFKYACHLLSKVEMTPDQTWSELVGWNTRNEPPLPDSELRAVYESAIKRVNIPKKEEKIVLNSNEDMNEYIKKHLGDKYDWADLRPDDPFVLSVDDTTLQEIMKIKPMTFESMIKSKLEEYGVHNRLEFTMEPNLVIGQITPKLGSSILCFDCEVIAVEDRMTYTKVADFECTKCGYIEQLKCDERRIIPEHSCGHAKHPKLKIIEGYDMETDYVQTIYIRESMESAKHSSPITFKARIFGDIVGEAFVGQKKRVIGQLYSIPNGRFNELVINIIDILDLDNLNVTLPTEEELNHWRELVKEKNFFDQLTDMFAPDIVGYADPKKLLLLSLAGAVKTKHRINNIHILFLGDPGTAKTTLMERAIEVAFKSILTSGKGNSAAGLTGGLDRPGPNMPMIFLPGALTIAHKGVAGIDEIDKMYAHDRSALHNVMAKGNIPINKVSIHGILPADTTIIATANPKGGKWREGKGIIEQIDLSEPLLSRFDGIWLFRSFVDEYVDRRISNHIMEQMNPDTESSQDIQLLMNYMNFVKTINPTMSKDIQKIITEYYVKLRKLADNNGMLPIDPRKTEAIARLSMAHARLHLKSEVEEADVKEAMRLFSASLDTFGIDIETGQTTMPFDNTDKLNKEDSVWNVLHELEGQNHEDFDMELAIDMLGKTEHFTKFSARKELDLWERKGRIMRNPDGSFRT